MITALKYLTEIPLRPFLSIATERIPNSCALV